MLEKKDYNYEQILPRSTLNAFSPLSGGGPLWGGGSSLHWGRGGAHQCYIVTCTLITCSCKPCGGGATIANNIKPQITVFFLPGWAFDGGGFPGSLVGQPGGFCTGSKYFKFDIWNTFTKVHLKTL